MNAGKTGCSKNELVVSVIIIIVVVVMMMMLLLQGHDTEALDFIMIVVVNLSLTVGKWGFAVVHV